MKQIYTLITAYLLLTFAAEAQTIIYHENFTNANKGITSTSNRWIVGSSNPNNLQNSSGGKYYYTKSSSAAQNKRFDLKGISTVGYRDIKISWSSYRASEQYVAGYVWWFPIYEWEKNDQPVRLYYSVNGGNTYKEVTNFSDSKETYNSWQQVNNSQVIALPADAADAVDLRFYWTVRNANYYIAIDDITLIGTPDENTATADHSMSTLDWSKSAENENPFAVNKTYNIDEVVVRFARTADAGVNITQSEISSEAFQAPNKTLTLVQSGATATKGSNIKISFSEPVADLTLRFHDVDQHQGQFKDKLIVTGKGFAGNVLLTSNKVITTYNNTFSTNTSTGANTFLGVSGTDVNANSPSSDVMFTFSEPVAEVNIGYYNDDLAEGNQGIAISNMTWRGVEGVAPLPVELMFFKGAVQGANTNLSWATASEENNEKFIVERSLDGQRFREIGVVKGNGNSSTRVNYTFTDTNPAEGTNYYRLRQVDFDGASETSNVVALQFKGRQHALNGNIAKVYPTIASSEVNVSLALSSAQVTVLDANGRQVAQYSNASQSLVLPVSHLQPGVYFVKVSDGAQQQTQRFVKQ